MISLLLLVLMSALLLCGLLPDGIAPPIGNPGSDAFQNRLSVFTEVNQRILNGFNHGPGGDGGAGKLIKNTAIFLDVPAAGFGVIQGPSFEGPNPVRLFQFDLVSQPRG